MCEHRRIISTAIIAIAIQLVPQFAAAEEASELVAPGAKIKKLAGGFKFTEGPAVDKAGNIFVGEWVETGRVTKLRKV